MFSNRSILDLMIGIFVLILLVTLNIIVPLIVSYILLKRRWISDKLRAFFSIVLILNVALVSILVIIRLIYG